MKIVKFITVEDNKERYFNIKHIIEFVAIKGNEQTQTCITLVNGDFYNIFCNVEEVAWQLQS